MLAWPFRPRSIPSWARGCSRWAAWGGNCLGSGGKANIDGFLSYWAVMNGAHAAPPSAVKVWVHGPVTYTGQTTPVDKPLTVSFNHGSGRVTYTSYHNESEYNVPGGFVAAERILQFLVFEL